MPIITLPDGSQRSFPSAVTVAELAANIGAGLAKAAIAGKVDGQLVDTSYSITADAQVAIVTERDPDALEVGDFHVKNTVAYALSGRHRGSDEEMCRLLEPYAGQRRRVVTWLTLAGWRAPAHGPRRRNVPVARL